MPILLEHEAQKNIGPKNKEGIREIDFTENELLLITDTQTFSLEYPKTSLRIELCLGNEDIDPLAILQNTFNETSAAETFRSFRTLRPKSPPVVIKTIMLAFLNDQGNYVVAMEGLLDLLLEVLKENHPFEKIEYSFENDQPKDPARLEFERKKTAQLEEVLETWKKSKQPLNTTTKKEIPQKKSNTPIIIGIIIGIVLLASVLWVVMK